MRQYESYKCSKCGNVVEVSNVGGGELSCCGAPMKLITENLTVVNLHKAIAGESQARNKYDTFSKLAIKEGYRDIAHYFARAAGNEGIHARLELARANEIENGKAFGTTLENLQSAIDGESFEHTTMYPEFAKIAEEEGDSTSAKLFKQIGKIEIEHEKMYKELKERLESGKEFDSDDQNEAWICEVCGHIHYGKKAPSKCPVCGEGGSHQMRLRSKK